jgi:histone acetyltransferase SAS3
MTENDNYGCHFVGYFSKEKRPSSLNNVSCILVLPIHMRKGYGQYLIEFSYLLTRVEKKTGSPEKPLSDMGLVSYRKYWRLVLCEELLQQKGPISIVAISERTGMTPDDIVSALEGLRALVRDPVTKTYALRLDYNYFKEYIKKCNTGNNPKIKPECLVWTPYVMGRLGQYEDGPALHAVQPREEPDDENKPAPEEGVQMDMAAKQNGLVYHDSPVAEDEAEPTTPVLPIEESTNGGSPAPGTPIANGSTIAFAGSQFSTALSSIPPTRYEVFPPIPGMPTAKRRPGRPFGSRRRTSTPQRNRNLPLAIATAPVSKIQLSPSKNGSGKGSPSANGAATPSGSIVLRRTRSRLGESVVNGIDADDEDTEISVFKTGNGRTRRSGTRSSTGSPKTSKNAKGKGRVIIPDEEDDEDLDAEGEDVDEDGEMDIDAEGEYDDTVDVVMVNS